MSIRRLLVAVAVGAALAGASIAAGLSQWAAGRSAERLHDERLAQVAHTVIAMAGGALPVDGRDAAATVQIDLGPRYHAQLWSLPERRLLLRTRGAPADKPLAPAGSAGFADAEIGGRPSRSFVPARGALPVEVQVAEAVDARTVPGGWLPATVLAMLLAGAMSAAAAHALALHLLRPLAKVRRALDERSPQDLRPLPTQGAPHEVVPLLAAVNTRLAAVAEQATRERDVVDAALQLITPPLAALREQLPTWAGGAAPARAQVAPLQAAAERCGSLVDELQALNRLAAGSAADRARAELETAMRDAVGALRGDPRAHGVHLSSKFAAPAVPAPPRVVQALLRGLLDHALQQVRPGSGHVRVSSEARDDRVLLRVDDDGAGTAADRGPAFALAQAVALAHGATVTLGDSPLGGLRVEVAFPAPAPAAAARRAPRTTSPAKAASGPRARPARPQGQPEATP